MNQYGVTFISGFAVGVLFLFILGVVTERDIRFMGTENGGAAVTEEDETLDMENVLTTSSAAVVSVSDQLPGGMVSVEHVEMGEGGWVVVHETEGGHVLNALGATRLDAGVYDDVVVELLRETNPGGSYAVILYTDNGNKEFEVRGDLPVIDTVGNPVMQTFRTFGGAAGR